MLLLGPRSRLQSLLGHSNSRPIELPGPSLLGLLVAECTLVALNYSLSLLAAEGLLFIPFSSAFRYWVTVAFLHHFSALWRRGLSVNSSRDPVRPHFSVSVFLNHTMPSWQGKSVVSRMSCLVSKSTFLFYASVFSWVK